MKRILIGLILIAGINAYAQTYNPQKAAEYAQFWCNKRNTKYNNPYLDTNKWGGPYSDFSGPLGGDCANFVSQCLIYGGLDLSKGTDGNGNGVKKTEGNVISGAKNLVIHLTKYQTTEVDTVQVYNPSDKNDIPKHGVGDPLFQVSTLPNGHSFFCSSRDTNANRLYSSHSADHCDDLYGFFTGNTVIFHIKVPIPDHCDDCLKNNGEEEVDCGGLDCPPCSDAPQTKSYTTNTQNLPSVTRAVSYIEAGNADVRVLSGQNVSFITNGTIALKSGFKVEKGGTFKAKIEKSGVNMQRECRTYCPPAKYNTFCREWESFHWGNVINAVKYTLHIYQKNTCTNNWVYTHTVTGDITEDGTVAFWDMRTGLKRENCFQLYGPVETIYYELHITDCKGNVHNYPLWHFFDIDDRCQKSYNINDEDYNMVLPDSLANEVPVEKCVIFPNPNNGSFLIKANFKASEIQNIQVLNFLGQIIYKQSSPISSMNIQLPENAKGNYIVKIETDTEVIVRKIAVQ